MKLFIVGLFDAIQHGDKEHREWLRDAIIAYVKDKIVWAPELVKEDFTIRND